jgi:hypothetical protein
VLVAIGGGAATPAVGVDPIGVVAAVGDRATFVIVDDERVSIVVPGAVGRHAIDAYATTNTAEKRAAARVNAVAWR